MKKLIKCFLFCLWTLCLQATLVYPGDEEAVVEISGLEEKN